MLTAFTRLGVTKREWLVLEILLKREAVSYESLGVVVYGDHPPSVPRMAMSHFIRNLRSKTKRLGVVINNIHDVGYSIPLPDRKKLLDFLAIEGVA